MAQTFYGDLSVIGMKGCEQFTETVDNYLREWRNCADAESFIVKTECTRFGTGEGKCLIHQTLRGHDVYVICDMFNYGVTYNMYDLTVPMSPDEHFQDLKRILGAIGGKARRVSVIMPMLYEGRQHRRSSRESLDCAIALQELTAMGVANIITFDAHDSRVQNAIPLKGFENIHPTYQMIKALLRAVPDVSLDYNHMMIISPDEGGMERCIYYSSVLGLDIGMFYKRRNYSVVINGRNPIVAHEYLGSEIQGKDLLIIDDMISSGDSIIDVAKQLKGKGAARIFIFETFGLFCNGIDKFDQAYEDGLFNKIFTTNLVYRTDELLSREWFTEVNMCKYISLIINTLNQDKTISTLLNPATKISNLLSAHRNNQGENI